MTFVSSHTERGRAFASALIPLGDPLPEPDVLPPDFDGVDSVMSPTPNTLLVSWLQAVDDTTGPTSILYLIWWAQGADPDPDAGDPQAVVTGGLSYTIEGLTADTEYRVLVRCQDLLSNRDPNTTIVTQTTLADTSHPLWGSGGPQGYITSTGKPLLVWPPAVDDQDPSETLSYVVRRALTSGGQNFMVGGVLVVGCHYLDTSESIQPETTYFYVVRAVDAAGNEDTNTTEIVLTTPAPPVAPDVDPPVISNQTPAPGTEITVQTPLQFDVSDAGGLRRVIVTVTDALDGVEEVVHDGDLFRGFYVGSSVRTSIAGGWRYRVLRRGGWKASPALRVYAIDQAGNEATG